MPRISIIRSKLQSLVFWKNINKCSNAAATKHVSVVNGCSGESNIADMWCNHFEKLYNSVTGDRSKSFL